jgi:hypothetical protein
MFKRLRFKFHMWRVLRALRRAEDYRLTMVQRFDAAQHVQRLVNR